MCYCVSHISKRKQQYEVAFSTICTRTGETHYSHAVQGVHNLCKQGLVQEALQALDALGKQGVHIPETAWVCALQYCIRENDLVVARQLHAMLSKYERQWSSKLWCQLIHMFAACGSLPDALQLFHNMAEKNTYAWTAIISVHARTGNPDQALMLYKQMRRCTIKPSSHT
eukprot:c8363_g2_i1 orf=96-605(+)